MPTMHTTKMTNASTVVPCAVVGNAATATVAAASASPGRRRRRRSLTQLKRQRRQHHKHHKYHLHHQLPAVGGNGGGFGYAPNASSSPLLTYGPGLLIATYFNVDKFTNRKFGWPHIARHPRTFK